MFKKSLFVFLVLALVVPFTGCKITDVARLDPVPVENPACTRSEFAGSWICQQMTVNDITAEQAWGVILDAKDIGLILERFTADEVRELAGKVIKYTEGNGATYSGLIELLGVETEKAKGIAGILKRRSPLFTNPAPMLLPDVRLVVHAAHELVGAL